MKKVSNKQAQIESKLRKAKKEFVQSVDPVCQGCGKGGKRLSVSHTISVKRCKELGKEELIYDIKNFSLDCCCDTGDCHSLYEIGSIEQRLQLNNFMERFLYICKHDIERSRSLMLAAQNIRPDLILDHWQ